MFKHLNLGTYTSCLKSKTSSQEVTYCPYSKDEHRLSILFRTLIHGLFSPKRPILAPNNVTKKMKYTVSLAAMQSKRYC